MSNIELYEEKTFDTIKKIDENGNEFWLARELMKALEYKRWDKFTNVIAKAQIACKTSKNEIENDFSHMGKIVKAGATTKEIEDMKLSRYACYLIMQNADPRKEIVALGQTYFAIQTRKQEISEQEYYLLSDDDKRLYQRNRTKQHNYKLNQTAKNAGVKNFGEFHNAGYKGLYGGETADDIAKRKGLRYREEILDNMGEDELITNLFRISQTEQKIRNEKIEGEQKATETHYEVGKNIRKFIKENGGTLPEKFPTPEKSIKQIEKEKIKKITNM